jgi:hypothetical protein
MVFVDSSTRLPIILPIGFFAIACITLFFSTRRRLFIRTFVPSDELRAWVRSLPRGDDFRKGMRSIAMLQFIVAALLAIAALWCRL